MWIYALIIAVSRVVLFAHHPSDVIARRRRRASSGALLVRDWFAARRLGFVIGADGSVRALPGPSIARIKRVARALLRPIRSSRICSCELAPHEPDHRP